MDPSKKYQYRDVFKTQQVERVEPEKIETMTSRYIIMTAASIILMIVVWLVISVATFLGSGFMHSVQNSAANPSNQVVISDSSNSSASSQAGQSGNADYAGGSGSSDLDSNANSGQAVGSSMDGTYRPKSLDEFRALQGMDFDTYFATYYKMVSEEAGWTHQYLSNLTGETYDFFDIYKMWEEITKDNYAAYLAMYGSASDRTWENGDESNYQLPEDELALERVQQAQAQAEADVQAQADGSDQSSESASGSSSDTGVGGLTLGGVSLAKCLRQITFWKLILTLLSGIICWAVMYPIMRRNYEAQVADKDTSKLNEYTGDQHIQHPEEIQRNYDYFPDVGAHSPVQVASMISHSMLLNKGVKRVWVAKRADTDILSESGEILYYKGEPLLDEDGEVIMEEKPMFDTKFAEALFDSAKILRGKDYRVYYNPAKIPYNPQNDNRDKLKGADTVAEMINKYWSFPEYEPQRPAGAYLVDTAPVNTIQMHIVG